MKLTDEAAAELKRMEDKRGRLTPQEIVEAARPEDSILHGCFEWDDGKAAEAWRLEQARELIRRVKIEVVVEERTIRTVAYVRDPDREPAEAGYQSILRVTKAGAGDVLRAELEAIGAHMERAIGLAYAKDGELPGLAGKITGIKVQVDRLAASL